MKPKAVDWAIAFLFLIEQAIALTKLKAEVRCGVSILGFRLFMGELVKFTIAKPNNIVLPLNSDTFDIFITEI